MLDEDLARLYGVEVKALKRQVRRNRARFPTDFMFELTRSEQISLRCKIGTLKRGRHSKYPSYVFTEHGVAMLSSVLKSARAVAINVGIIRAFIRMRKAFEGGRAVAARLERTEQAIGWHEEELGEHAANIHALFVRLRRRRRSSA